MDDSANYTFPAGLDPHFRHQFDAADDFMAAFERAMVFTTTLGDNRVSYLWQQALEIGFRAGRGGATETVPKREAFDDYSFGHDEGVKEGRTSGLRDGKKEGRKAGKAQGLKEGRKAGKAQGLKEGEIIGFERGLSEGKRLGFVAGREFGEKQAAKLSNSLAPERILVDAGTDSPLTALFPGPVPSMITYASASAQTDARCDTVLPIHATTPSLVWADEPSDICIPERTSSPSWLPPRDLSGLRSGSTSLAPFATLRYRAHRTQKSMRGTHRSAMRPRATRGSVPHLSAISFASKPPTANTSSSLDWDCDPRLFDLSRALRSLGWDLVGGTRQGHRF